MIHPFIETKYLTFALLFCMLLLLISSTYSVSLTHLSVLEHVVVTLYFPHSAAATTLYIEAVHSMTRSLKTSFCSVHGQKTPGVPKAACIATACTTKSLVTQSQPLEMFMDPYSCVTLTLDLPLFLSHSQRSGSWRANESNGMLPQLPA